QHQRRRVPPPSGALQAESVTVRDGRILPCSDSSPREGRAGTSASEQTVRTTDSFAETGSIGNQCSNGEFKSRHSPRPGQPAIDTVTMTAGGVTVIAIAGRRPAVVP